MSLELPEITTVEVADRRVLIRLDLNAPVRAGKVTDTTRLERVVPTIADLSARGAILVLMSHFGRPRGEVEPALTLRPISLALEELLGKPVRFVSDCVGLDADRAVGEAQPGDVLLLENLRFHRGEEQNDINFARKLAVHADIYVNDAFSCAHRAHASTHAIAGLLPAYAGPALMAEVDALSAAVNNPRQPCVALVGGAKVSTKIAVLENLTRRVDSLIIGGGMANTFLLAQGHAVGKSLCEPDLVPVARMVMEAAEQAGCRIFLPKDVVVAERFEAGAANRVCDVADVPESEMILDVGPKTLAELSTLLEESATLLWNGPLGAFELSPFDVGTAALAAKAAELTRGGALATIAGGGDTVAALNAAGVSAEFTYISTAGGAFLEWLEGKDLPGIAVLREAGKDVVRQSA